MRLAIQMPIQFALPTEVACLSVGFADSHRESESEHHGERQAWNTRGSGIAKASRGPENLGNSKSRAGHDGAGGKWPGSEEGPVVA